MKKYEYKVTILALSNPNALEEYLNVLGGNGWELVDVENFDLMGILILKREVV